MARLTARQRAALPDRAFAYVDRDGRRRLPIHDAAHVRNALARFDQVHFESDDAKDAARARLLRAAQRHQVMPVGFVRAQLRGPRRTALPTGTVTFLLTDIEGSTTLLRQVDDEYPRLLREVRHVADEAVQAHDGTRVDAIGDEFFAVFAEARGALLAAALLQRRMADHDWPHGAKVRVRAGVHTGRPRLTDVGYVGLAVHAVARISSIAHGGQVLASSQTRQASRELPESLRLVSVGTHVLTGLPDLAELFQLQGPGLGRSFPPPRC
jgi:class 3 adenylate cyclase